MDRQTVVVVKKQFLDEELSLNLSFQRVFDLFYGARIPLVSGGLDHQMVIMWDVHQRS